MKPVHIPGPAIVATIEDLVWLQTRSISLSTAYAYSRLAKAGKYMELYQKLLQNYYDQTAQVDPNLTKLVQVSGVAAGLSEHLVFLDMELTHIA